MRKHSNINETKREDVLLVHRIFKRIQVIHSGKVFFKCNKSLSSALGLHRKTIQSIMNKCDNQNDENS